MNATPPGFAVTGAGFGRGCLDRAGPSCRRSLGPVSFLEGDDAPANACTIDGGSFAGGCAGEGGAQPAKVPGGDQEPGSNDVLASGLEEVAE